MNREAVASFRIVDICFVLDRSSSMKLEVESNQTGLLLSDPRASTPPLVNSRWKALERAFDKFLRELDSNATDERVGITSFASDFTAFGVTTPAASTELPLTSSMFLAENAMGRLSNSLWNGNTYIEAGMREAIDVLATSRSNADKVMVVLTDGFQNEGEARNAARTAVDQDIKIHTITFGTFADHALMKEIADIGNGKFASAADEASLTQIMRELAASLTSLVL